MSTKKTKKGTSGSQGGKPPKSSEGTQKSNQKKNNIPIRLTLFSDNIFKHDKDGYMKSFILEDKENKYQCYCTLCDDEPFYAQYVLKHVQIEKHRRSTEKIQGKRGLEKLDKLIKYITEGKAVGDTQEKKTMEEKEEEETKKYLEFVAFALSQKFSFLQVSNLGYFLREMINRKDGIGLNFFKNHSFDRDFLSKIASECFRPYLLGELKEKLMNNRFSFSIDSSTVAGENLCAIKVKYLQKSYNDEMDEIITKANHEVIGIKKLQQSSTAQIFMQIVKEKVFFDDDKKIKGNVIGITTDRAATLMGEESGLITLLKDDLEQNIFHLPDPCHSLSLVIRHSLELLPDEIRSFISDIHNYFNSPQRKEKLKAIQKENGYNVLAPMRYVKTRWLSLGDSLTRLVEIWPSLQIYMNTLAKEKGVRCSQIVSDKPTDDIEISQVNYKTLSSLLNMDSFYLKISFLSIIINRINYYNKLFQTQGLEISEMKSLIYECFSSILELVVIPQKLNLQNLKTYFSINWMSPENHNIWFYNSKDFIQKLRADQPVKLQKLRLFTSAQEENFTRYLEFF